MPCLKGGRREREGNCSIHGLLLLLTWSLGRQDGQQFDGDAQGPAQRATGRTMAGVRLRPGGRSHALTDPTDSEVVFLGLSGQRPSTSTVNPRGTLPTLFLCPDQEDELAWPAHGMVRETTCQHRRSGLSSSTDPTNGCGKGSDTQ